jgi:DNA ligase-1
MSLQPTSAIKDEFNPDTAIYPLMGFTKVDGVRASHLVGFFHGRSMDPFKNTELNSKFNSAEYAGFDGELTIDGLLTDETLDGETLCSLTTGLTNRSKIKKGETELPSNATWNLFDYLGPNAVDLPYLERYGIMSERAEHLISNTHPDYGSLLSVLPFVWINNPTEARDWITKCLELNYEGAIFRNPKAMHKSGRAVASKNDFWRYKPVSDKDAIVVSVYEAEANNNEKTTNSRGHSERSSHKENKVGKGTAGGFIGIDVETGKEIRTPCGCMKHGERQEVWDGRASYAGRPYKYTSLDTGVKDQPRQGRWIAWRSKEDMTPADLALVAKLEGVCVKTNISFSFWA